MQAGDLYDFAPWSLRNVGGRDVSDRWRQGRYRILGECQAVPVFQRQVLYEGAGGPDDGKRYCCSPANFAALFLPAEAPPAEPREAIPEKVADHTSAEGDTYRGQG